LVLEGLDVPLAELGHPQRHNVARIERIEINGYKMIFREHIPITVGPVRCH